RAVVIMAMTVALGTTVSSAPVAVPAAGPAAGPGTGATVNIDGADPGPAFQGIGAISGGGGNSRLLIDYPPGEPAQGQLDCGAGYEFWLARQALARNPAIRLYGLQWSAPAWVRDPHGGLWS